MHSTKLPQRPIKNSYWVIPGKFLAGEYPRTPELISSVNKLKALEDAGVTIFIDLTTKRDRLDPYSHLLRSAAYLSFPIRDLSVPRSPAFTVEILDTIDHYLDQGDLVYLHCWGGIGRTGTIVGSWLARHGYKGEEALDRLHELWKQCPKSEYVSSPETSKQERYILNWEETKIE